MDGQDADRVGLVPAGGGYAEKRLRYYARQFPLVEEEQHQSFGADLTGRVYTLDLLPAPPAAPGTPSRR